MLRVWPVVALLSLTLCQRAVWAACDPAFGDSNGVNSECKDEEGKWFCRDTSADPLEQVFNCVDCRNDCDCPMGEYCSNNPSSKGTCKEFELEGEDCLPFSDAELADTTLPFKKDLKCATFYGAADQTFIDHKGSCVEGKCRFCEPDSFLCPFNNNLEAGNARVCARNGDQVTYRNRNWNSFRYYENVDSVWHAIFWVFFMFLLGCQAVQTFVYVQRQFS